MASNVERIGFFERGGTVIPNEIMCKLKTFKPTEFMVLGKMAHFLQHGKQINGKILVEETGLSEEEVNASLDRLIELKIICPTNEDEN